MKKRFMPLVVIFVVAILVFAGCAQPSPEPTPTPTPEPTEPVSLDYDDSKYAQPNPYYKVGIKPDGTPYEFMQSGVRFNDWQDIAMSMGESLIRRTGANYTQFDNEFDAARQQADFEDALQRGVDGVVCFPTDQYGLAPTVDKLWAAGIPVVSYDWEVFTQNLLSYGGHDLLLGGILAGQWMDNYQRENDIDLVVLEVWGQRAAACDIPRGAGFHQIVDNNPRITVHQTTDAAWTADLAMTLTLDAVSAMPEINAVYEHGSMTPGVVEALRAIGRLYPIGHPEHVVIVGYDEIPGSMAAMDEGYVDAITSKSPWEGIDYAVQCLLSYVCLGRNLPKSRAVLPNKIVTLENKDEVGFGQPTNVGSMYLLNPNYDEWPVLDWSGFEPTGFLEQPTYEGKKAGY